MSANQLAAEFRNCLWFIWKHLGLPDPTPIQYDLAAYLADPTNQRSVIQAFRGAGKSYITSAFCVFTWLNNPDARILVVSGAKARADDFSKFTRRLLEEIPDFHYLRPRKGRRDSMIAFDVGPSQNAHSPSMKSVGITGQIAGSRATLIIADDVETHNNSWTQGARDTLRESVKEFDSVILPGGRIVYLGTPQYEASLYTELRKHRGFNCRIWPVRYPTSKQVDGYDGCLAPMILDAVKDNGRLEGESTDPKRFDNDDLVKREASLGRSTFQLQFMLDTTLSDQERYPLKISDFILAPLTPEKGPISINWSSDPRWIADDVLSVGFPGDVWRRPAFIDNEHIPYTGAVMSVDPAGRGGDETAYTVVKLLNGRLFLMASGGLPGGYSEDCLKALAVVAQYQKVNEVVIEANFGDGMFSQLLKPILGRIHPCAVSEVRSVIQKEKRIIDTLEPILNQHRLVVNEEVAINDYRGRHDKVDTQLFWQLTRITKERGCLGKDDRLDALSLAVAHWVEAMARDTDKAAQDAREELLEADIRRIEEQWEGTSGVGQDSWIHI